MSLTVTYNFLNKLKENNNREWFNNNKVNYQLAFDEVVNFADQLLAEMQKHDQIETVSGKKSLYRIYRDVRFSKDKSPYKQHWAGSFKRATAWLRGGYYFHLKPGDAFIAGGFFGPNADDLRHIRTQIAQDEAPLRNILEDPAFKDFFGKLEGDQLKTAPKGFEKDHPSIDLLRYKQFIIRHTFSDEEVLSSDFPQNAAAGFQKMHPFFDYMSEILTTDLNGVPLFD